MSDPTEEITLSITVGTNYIKEHRDLYLALYLRSILDRAFQDVDRAVVQELLFAEAQRQGRVIGLVSASPLGSAGVANSPEDSL